MVFTKRRTSRGGVDKGQEIQCSLFVVDFAHGGVAEATNAMCGSWRRGGESAVD